VKYKKNTMQKLKVTNETVQEYTLSCHKLLTEVLALNMELSNEEIIESFTGLTQELTSAANEAFDKMREDPEFQQEAVAFLNALQMGASNEDSEAASV
jgi:hypothetical protein